MVTGDHTNSKHSQKRSTCSLGACRVHFKQVTAQFEISRTMMMMLRMMTNDCSRRRTMVHELVVSVNVHLFRLLTVCSALFFSDVCEYMCGCFDESSAPRQQLILDNWQRPLLASIVLILRRADSEISRREFFAGLDVFLYLLNVHRYLSSSTVCRE